MYTYKIPQFKTNDFDTLGFKVSLQIRNRKMHGVPSTVSMKVPSIYYLFLKVARNNL